MNKRIQSLYESNIIHSNKPPETTFRHFTINTKSSEKATLMAIEFLQQNPIIQERKAMSYSSLDRVKKECLSHLIDTFPTYEK